MSLYSRYVLCLLLLVTVLSLQCPTMYDYSSGSVKCASLCVPGTRHHEKNCCGSQQYYFKGRCHLCNGWILNDGNACCRYGEFYSNTYRRCYPCPFETHLGGVRCNWPCEYIDMANERRGTPYGMGSNPIFTCTTVQKISCGPDGQYFYPQLKKCMPKESSASCDDSRKICCTSGRYIDYVFREITCVERCRFGIAIEGSISCAQRYCTPENTQVLSLYGQRGDKLAMRDNKCCYGMSDDNLCVTQISQCPVRFESNSQALCCLMGQNYDIMTKKCQFSCSGVISVGFFCIPFGSFIVLTSETMQIRSNPQRTCAGKRLPNDMTICCPSNHFVDGNRGCTFCHGRIYGVTDYQLCCQPNEYYNVYNNTCVLCEGPMDSTGTLCCPAGTYIGYFANGTMNCTEQCELENVYKTNYCCFGCKDKCQGTLLNCTQANMCAPWYFVPDSCQTCGCGKCHTSKSMDFCTDCLNPLGVMANCSPICRKTTAPEAETGICLECSEGCEKCSSPMNPQKCQTCAKGWTKLADICQPCDSFCLECQGGECLVCNKNSSMPVLNRGRCVRNCLISTYFDKGHCLTCNPTCLTCWSSGLRDCLSCFNGSMLNATNQTAEGNCISCSARCFNCQGAIDNCSECTDGKYLHAGNCVGDCPQGFFSLNMSDRRGVCRPCHRVCISCVRAAINCIKCPVNNYLDESQGNAICMNCPEGCPNCSSKYSCSENCTAGFYRDGNTCKKCDPSCQNCSGPGTTDCLSCKLGLKLTTGTCSGCIISCLTCSTPTVCLTCKNPSLLSNGSCVPSCPPKTFNDNGVCKDCPSGCLTCSNKNCLTCTDQAPYRDGEKCVENCNATSYIIDKTCTLCVGAVFLLKTACCQSPGVVVGNRCINQVNVKNETKEKLSTPVKKIDMTPTIVLKNNKIFVRLYGHNNQIDTNSLRIQLDSGNKLANKVQTFKIERSEPTDLLLTIQPPKQDIDNNKFIHIKYGSHTQITSSEVYRQNSVISMSRTHSGLKALGIIISIILLIYAIMTKCKGHFDAEEANRVVLHSLNFCQLVGMFQSVQETNSLSYNFYQGFRVSHLGFLLNPLKSLLNEDYLEPRHPTIFMYDGNLVRNAGHSIFFWMTILALLLIAMAVIFTVYYTCRLLEPPFFRMSFRLFILLFSITIMNIVFFSMVQIMHYDRYVGYPGTYRGNFIASIILLIFIPIVLVGFHLHNHFTYVSDEWEMLYTLRETSMFAQSYVQGIILALSIQKYYVLGLLVVEIMWFFFNWLLITDDRDNVKYYVMEGAILTGTIMLVLGALVPVVTVVVVTIVMTILIVYSTYQVVGLYYWNIMALFGIYEQSEYSDQPNGSERGSYPQSDSGRGSQVERRYPN